MYSPNSQLRIRIPCLSPKTPGGSTPGDREPLHTAIVGIGVGETDDLARREVAHQALSGIRLLDGCVELPSIFRDHCVVKHVAVSPLTDSTGSIPRQGRRVRGVSFHSVRR
jgi:hypothetical protein